MFRILGILLGIILCGPLQVEADFEDPASQPTAPQATVRFLTLNVMENSQNPAYLRDMRFDRIVDLAKTKADGGKSIHGFLLQELSGGSQSNGLDPATADSGKDLRDKLEAEVSPHGYYTAPMAGWVYPPPLGTQFVWKVGILSPYKFQATQSTRLDPSGENYTEYWTGYPQPLTEFVGRSNVVMAEFNIPGFGKTDIYSVHVYTPTSIDEKITQITNLMTFVTAMDAKNQPRATIIGGDMNFARSPETEGIYQLFLDNGFIDSYPAVNIDPGYTFANDPSNPMNTATGQARIDYLFVRGSNLEITSSELVFNGVNGDYVSDHFGVLTEISLAPLPGSLPLLGLGLLAMAMLGGKLKRN